MPDPIAQVTPDQKALLTIIYRGLKERGTWPPFQYVDKVLDSELGIDVDELARTLPADLTNVSGGHHLSGNDEVTLTIAGLYHCEDAASDTDNFMRTLWYATELEKSYQPSTAGGDEPLVSRSDVSVKIGASEPELSRLYLLVRFEPWAGSGGVTQTGEWDFRVARAVRRFRGVQTLREYLVKRAEFFGRATNIPATVRLESPWTPETFGLPQGVRVGKYVFVIMPIRPSFDAVYAMIRQACASFDGVAFERADDIAQTGRITDQVVAALRSADILIADITHRNANVMYELGYAHALGKPVIVLNRQRRSPFDVQDYRQIIYSLDDLVSAKDQLLTFLSRALLA